MLVEIANDLQLAAELIPGSTRYIGIADSQPVYIGFSNVLRLAGVIQDASIPNGEVCVFDLQVALALEGPSPWHTLYSQSLPAASLAPVGFKQTNSARTGFPFTRVRWRIEPANPTASIAAGAWFRLSAYLNTGLELI